MKNKRFLSAVVIVLAVCLTFFLDKLVNDYEEDVDVRGHHHIEDKDRIEYDNGSLDITAEKFQTHLPIVVLKTGGQEIKSKLDTEDDPRININIDIIDNENEVNTLQSVPDISTISSIRYRGNSSLYYDKKQYSLKFYNEDGTENLTEVMGMSEGCEWVLNGNFMDKSFIRNYMAYNIAGEIMDYAPNIRFCEVFIYDGTEYYYQGLYTMIESIERAVNRVNISKYDEERVETSYIVRRDRYADDEVMLYNYGTEKGLTSEWLGVKYPSENKITKETLEYIENDISEFEKVIYSDKYEVFMTYDRYIDVDSFVDYYVINEFFGNYDAGLHSTYAYKDLTGKLKMGPVWDYDGAMDNASPWVLEPDSTAFQTSSWFDALLKDDEFCKKVVDRYNELRKNYFSDKFIESYIDDVVEFLGSAVDRDALVWGYVYDMNYLLSEDLYDRNVDSYEEEIARVKGTLSKHANYLDSHFYDDINNDILYQPEELDYMKLVAVLFIVSFFVIVVIVRQE